MACNQCKWSELDSFGVRRCHFHPPKHKDVGRSSFTPVLDGDWCSHELYQNEQPANIEVLTSKTTPKVPATPSVVIKKGKR